MHLVNASGSAVASYEYDPYGNIVASSGSMADINPLRYRGYYYDSETGFYYLQSRYYDPAIGRFINADALVSTGQGLMGNNMFAYCRNNPCVFIDPYGAEGIVGFGIQFDVSTDHGTYGFEIVVYLDKTIAAKTTGNEDAEFVVVMYTYSGIALSLQELLLVPEAYAIASTLDFSAFNEMSYDEIMLTLIAVLTDLELSGSVFAIYGYDNFDHAEDYSGSFDTRSISGSLGNPLLSAGGFVAKSNTCTAVGFRVGGSTSPKNSFFPVSIQYSKTYYSDPLVLLY